MLAFMKSVRIDNAIFEDFWRFCSGLTMSVPQNVCRLGHVQRFGNGDFADE